MEDRTINRHLILEGMSFKLEGQVFDPQCHFTYCRICGAAFQTPLCRLATKNPVSLDQKIAGYQAMEARMTWSHEHAATHTPRQHMALQLSGLFMTPEAQLRLAPLGIVALTDFQKSAEHHQAGMEAPRYSEEYA